jgi:hypothetical protein
MKSQRQMMTDALIDDVDDWELDALIFAAKEYISNRCKGLSFHELEEEYIIVCGVEEYPETFPDGYKEP